MSRRTVLLGLGLVAWAGLIAWYVAGVVADRRFRDELGQAERDLAAGRVEAARARLLQLQGRRPGRGDVELNLGAADILAGRVDEALDAWGRVPDDAPEAPRAALSRGRIALDHRRYRLAEDCLERAARAGGEVADEAYRQLSRVYWTTGRLDDHRRAIRRVITRESDPSADLRLLWNSEAQGYPVGGMRTEVAKALEASPNDDRAWLAAADLATREGRFDEADGWLARAEKARPDDPAIWRARLEWAQAADRPDDARRAASHLPAASLTPARLASLRAWLAARAGDRTAEREALEERSELDPADAAALERLAELAAESGEVDRVAALRRKKAAVDAAVDRYKDLIGRPDLATVAPELARAAEALGRRFDAAAWWDLAVRRDPSLRPKADAARPRLAEPSRPATPGARTIADLLPSPRAAVARSTPEAGGLLIPRFRDEAAERGLNFSFDEGRSESRQLPETMSGGVGLLDFDGDGRLDVYSVQGGPFPPPSGRAPFGDRLFRNLGGGKFEDATASSGLAGFPGGYGHGVAVGDVDGDGRPDLFVTRWRSYALYRNLGGGKFEDVTGRSGLGGDRDWPTSAAFADLDGDGDLDLYVCHYLRWDAANPTVCSGPLAKGPTYCDPREFPSLPDHVFRNDDGRFVDVTEAAGIVDRDGRGLGVVAADLDGDGKTDLFVANDTSANHYFRNLGGFRFAEEGAAAGLASGAGGGYMAGMGVASGDLDGDGRIDLAVTNFFNESTTLYHNLGGGLFADRSAAAGLAVPTRFSLGFGIAAFDANNDGFPDLAQANGHVNDFRPSTPYAMPAQLFLGGHGGKFREVSDRAGDPWKAPRVGRGLAVGDVDDDGQLDILIVSDDAPLALLHAPRSGHFVTFALEGTTSNRDGVGARVAVTAAGRTQAGFRVGGGSYLSASDPRLHFGLGSVTKVDRVEVIWPSGRRDQYTDLAGDTVYRLREGDPAPHKASP